MNTRCLLFVLASFIPAAWAGPIIFDTLGPLNQVAPVPGLTLGGGILRNDPPGHQGATYAEGFPTLPGVALGSIDLFVQYISIPGLAAGPSNLDISIAADGINGPGMILETIHLTNIFNGVPFASGVITATSVLHPLLGGPQPYWLIVAPPDLLNTAFDWKVSALPLTIPLAGRLGADPWTTGPNQALAFRVTAADVPEPASWFLLASALAFLIHNAGLKSRAN